MDENTALTSLESFVGDENMEPNKHVQSKSRDVMHLIAWNSLTWMVKMIRAYLLTSI